MQKKIFLLSKYLYKKTPNIPKADDWINDSRIELFLVLIAIANTEDTQKCEEKAMFCTG